MTPNIQVRGIYMPSYASLKLYEDLYVVSVTLNISKSLVDRVKECNSEIDSYIYKDKAYCTLRKAYNYSTPFCDTISDAMHMLNTLKTTIRRAKITELIDEIKEIDNLDCYCI